MFFWELLTAILIAALLTVLFAGVFRRTGPWAGVVWFFVIVLLATWAGGLWARPVGPVFGGVAWLPFLLVGLLIALLLAAVTPPREPPRTPSEAEAELEASGRAAAAALALTWFFWVLLLGLLVVIVIYYVALMV